MATTKTYDPAKHLVSFAGLTVPPAFGPDTFLKATRNSDGFSLVVGAGGEGARAMNRDRSGTVELTVLATSQANDLIMAVAAADELAGTGVGPLFVKELNGTTVLAAQNAWVKKLPDLERAKEVGVVTWVFECENLEMFLGGLA